MSVVARAVLGVPAYAVVLESHFRVAGRLVTRHHASSSPAFMKMMTFLHEVVDIIPAEVRSLVPKTIDDVVPTKLKDPHKKLEVGDMSGGDPGSIANRTGA